MLGREGGGALPCREGGQGADHSLPGGGGGHGLSPANLHIWVWERGGREIDMAGEVAGAGAQLELW